MKAIQRINALLSDVGDYIADSEQHDEPAAKARCIAKAGNALAAAIAIGEENFVGFRAVVIGEAIATEATFRGR